MSLRPDGAIHVYRASPLWLCIEIIRKLLEIQQDQGLPPFFRPVRKRMPQAEMIYPCLTYPAIASMGTFCTHPLIFPLDSSGGGMFNQENFVLYGER